MTERIDAAAGEQGEAEGHRAEAEKIRQSFKDLKIELAKMRGRLAVLERAGARASADEIMALKQEAQQLRSERDESEEELYKMKKDLGSIEKVKGEKMMGLEQEVQELREKIQQNQLTADAAKGERSDRTAFLEAKVCALQDTVRKLKDHRDKYMTALDIRDYDRLEESELEVRKAKDDRREALALVDGVQQELRKVRDALGQDTRRKLGPGRDFEADIKKLVEKTRVPAKRQYGIPGGSSQEPPPPPADVAGEGA